MEGGLFWIPRFFEALQPLELASENTVNREGPGVQVLFQIASHLRRLPVWQFDR